MPPPRARKNRQSKPTPRSDSTAGSILQLLLDTYAAWRQDRTMRLGAGLAYYSLFALVPLLALTTAMAAVLFDNADMESYLAERLAGVAGVDADRVAAVVTAEVGRRSIGSSLGLFGFGALLVASSLVFLALDDAIDTIWHVPVKAGFRESARRRLMAFALAVVTGALLIASFALSVVTGAAEAAVAGRLPFLTAVTDLVYGLATGLLLAGALASLFRHTGPRLLSWRVAFGAALPTTIFLILGTWLIGRYLQRWGSPSIPGAFGALTATLTWVYFEAQVLLAGVQLAKTMSMSGSSAEVP